MSSDRSRIFSAVRTALADLPARTPYPDYADTISISKPFDSATDLWQTFTAKLAAVHGNAIDGIEDLVTILRRENARRGYCDPALASVHASLVNEWELVPEVTRENVESLDFGITRASGIIAESGTIILTDRDTPNRLAALAPWISVAVVEPHQIHPTIADAMQVLDEDPNIIWVTGPSKTADVEGILIEGVHGPGIQICLLHPAPDHRNP